MASEPTTAPMGHDAALLQKQMQHSTFKRPGELAVVALLWFCLLYTSDAADDLLCVDLGGRRSLKKKKKQK